MNILSIGLYVCGFGLLFFVLLSIVELWKNPEKRNIGNYGLTVALFLMIMLAFLAGYDPNILRTI